MTRVELGWLAGILDGEGTIMGYLHRGKRHHTWQFTVQIRVPNRHPGLVRTWRRLIVDAIGEPMNIQTFLGGPKMTKQYVAYTGIIPRVYKIVRLLAPHLVAKRRQAILMRDYLRRRGTLAPYGRTASRRRRDFVFVRQMQALNARYHHSHRRDRMGGLPEKRG